MKDTYNRSCPRCKSDITAHIGRQDIGMIENSMYVCCTCGLIFGITDPERYKARITQYYEEKLEQLAQEK